MIYPSTCHYSGSDLNVRAGLLFPDVVAPRFSSLVSRLSSLVSRRSAGSPPSSRLETIPACRKPYTPATLISPVFNHPGPDFKFRAGLFFGRGSVHSRFFCPWLLRFPAFPHSRIPANSRSLTAALPAVRPSVTHRICHIAPIKGAATFPLRSNSKLKTRNSKLPSLPAALPLKTSLF